jgi:hypothetical protein
LGLKIAVPALIGLGAYAYKKWCDRQVIVNIRKQLVEVVNTVEDVDDPVEMMNVVHQTKRLKKRLRYHGIPAIVKAVQFAEMKVGLLSDTVANRMVIEKIIRDYMVAPVGTGLGMRVAHAVRDYQVACSMYFKPRAQKVILNEVDKLWVDEVAEAKKLLGLDGTA